LGRSLHSQQSVASLIAERLPATAQLGVAATLFGLVLGVPVAIISALRPGGWLDRTLSGWSALALGVPTFWLGILLILLFAVELRWLPSASAYVPLWQSPLEGLRNLLLPALTLGVYVSGIFARFLRAALVAELRADYVRTARAKGLPERDVVGRHVMRNALLPFVTIVGLMMANFIGGTVVTESVFTYPGLGRLLIQAISTRDYPLIQGCILFILVVFVLINLLVDVLYAYIDPRINYD
jgi:peptide/nickel transport system permease protein